jgi:hypothetical protein
LLLTVVLALTVPLVSFGTAGATDLAIVYAYDMSSTYYDSRNDYLTLTPAGLWGTLVPSVGTCTVTLYQPGYSSPEVVASCSWSLKTGCWATGGDHYVPLGTCHIVEVQAVTTLGTSSDVGFYQC